MITIEHLQKSYRGKIVLQDLSLTAPQGEITLLVGPNGAGKTTTVKILAGLTTPDGGTFRISSADGNVAHDRFETARLISYLPQRPVFHPGLTCRQILEFYARLRGLPQSRIEAMTEVTGLHKVLGLPTGQLSGGLRQRLGLALLLLPDAPVLLLDEPGLSLDPAWRKRLQEVLRFEAERGKTILLTTHLIAEWNRVAHRCLLCRDGVIERELDANNLPNDFDVLESREPANLIKMDHGLRSIAL